MKAILLITLLALTSCASVQQMGEDGQPPRRASNVIAGTAAFVETSLCPLTTWRNLEVAVLNVVHLIPFFTEWEPICREEV